MLIQKIKIRGAKGIKKGMGLDEIEIDFENKTGLIALSGPNGRGKTTILELMSPYRTFASRKGALNHHFYLRDSFVETWFEFNGDQYRTIKKIDSGSDRAESFIYINNNTDSETDGKNKEYDKYILNLFGSPVLFYNSVFCAQGADNFADMTTGQIKGLFVEFLQLYKLAEYEAQAKRALTFYDTKLHIANNNVFMIERDLEKLQKMDDELKPLLESNERIKKTILEGEAIIEDEQAGLEDLKKKKIISDQSKEKVQELDEQIKKLELEQAQIKRDRIEAEEKHSSAILEITTERKKLSVLINQKEMIEKASTLLEDYEKKEKFFSDCFECVLEEQARIDRGIKEIEAEKLSPLKDRKIELSNDPDLEELTKKAEELAVKLRKAKDKQASLSMSKRQAENNIELAGLKKDADICKEKIAMSIDPDCKSTTCPAIEVVKFAKDQLPGLEQELKECQEKIENKVKDIETGLKIADAMVIEAQAKVADSNFEKDNRAGDIWEELEKIDSKIKDYDYDIKMMTSDFLYESESKVFYRDSRDECRESIGSCYALSSKLSDLKVAESQLKSLSTQEDEKVSAWVELKDGFDRNFETKVKIIAELNDETLRIDEKILVLINDKIDDSIKLIKETEQAGRELQEMQSSNNEAIAVLNNKLEYKKDLGVELEKYKSIQAAINKEISGWTYLKIACSKTGLQALEIDGAAPLITREANQLLEMTFGLDFQIKIVTMDPESGKEVFWVMVIRDDGDEDKFEDLSGGQKVWIAKALSLGMTLVSNHKSGKAFQTLFADESDGALDRDKALDFVSLYRSMMQAGTFDACMYISHNPEVVAIADNVLDFSGDELVWR